MVSARLRQDRGDDDVTGRDAPKKRGPPRRLFVAPSPLGSSPRSGNEERAKEVHVRSQSGRAVASPEPIHARHVVVDRVDAQPPELGRHGGSTCPASPERLDVLDRETPLAVVPLRTGREVAGVRLRKGGEPAPGVGQRREFEVHPRPSVALLTLPFTCSGPSDRRERGPVSGETVC